MGETPIKGGGDEKGREGDRGKWEVGEGGPL